MEEVTTIGLDIAKSVFQGMERMRLGDRFLTGGSRGASSLNSSRRSVAALLR
jgi:hypothetical protein